MADTGVKVRQGHCHMGVYESLFQSLLVPTTRSSLCVYAGANTCIPPQDAACAKRPGTGPTKFVRALQVPQVSHPSLPGAIAPLIYQLLHGLFQHILYSKFAQLRERPVAVSHRSEPCHDGSPRATAARLLRTVSPLLRLIQGGFHRRLRQGEN